MKIARPRELTARPKRILSGHGACPGCGIFSGVDTFLKGIEGDVVVLYQTGCAYVTTTGYPYSAHRVSYIHNLFQNGAPPWPVRWRPSGSGSAGASFRPMMSSPSS